MTPLIVFSHLRWEFVYQRPQQLMSRLAGQEFFVLFVEEPAWSDGSPGDENVDANCGPSRNGPVSPAAL